MPMRPFLNALSVALLVGTALHAGPGRSQSQVPAQWPVDVERPPVEVCPAVRRVVDIKGSTNPDVRRQQRELLSSKLAEENTTIRLGPDVDLDFSDLPAGSFAIYFGRCVTLTSVSAFTDILPSPYAAETVQPQEIAMAPAPVDVTPHGAAVTQARSPRSRGPVLRYRRHRVSGVTETFFEIRCFSPHGPDNDGARISGIRFYGPSFGQQSEKNVAIRVVRCVDVDIANVEIAGWGGDGIAVNDDPGPDLRELDPEHLLYESTRQGPGETGPQILTPRQLLDRLAALVPPPRIHRHRYFRALAPNSPLRAAVTALAPAAAPTPPAPPPELPATEPAHRRTIRYA